MIEGLKVTVCGRELVDLCTSRAAYHWDRAAEYYEQIASVGGNQLEGMDCADGNPVQTLKDRQQGHENEASEMDFIAAHVVVSEVYRLDRDDLVKLGVTKSRY